MAANQQITSSERIRSLRSVIESKGFARVIEAHSGLSGIIAETTRATVNGETREYDGIWESSLTDSATKGLPDASIIGIESRLHTTNEILHVTTKPVIVDGDTGGEIPQFKYLISHLERMGASAVIIEDKVFPKRNSLDASASQELEDPETFAQKIRAGKAATINDDFMIMARIEALIAGTGLQDALRRAEHYILAGVDGIMIHSNRREPEDLIQFAKLYGGLCQRLGRRPLLVSVPTTYNQHPDAELVELGFDIIIHANHLLRASHKAMKEVSRLILETGSSFQSDKVISPVKEIFSVVGHDRITADDEERKNTLRMPVIIPGAGKDPVFPERPKSLVTVAKRRILDYQLESIRKVGLKKAVVVRGYLGKQFNGYSDDGNLAFCENPLYAETHALYSLMQARAHMEHGFVMVFADILFDPEILSRLARSGKAIVLGIDNSYTYHKHEVDKRLDLVISKKSFNRQFRSLKRDSLIELVRVGKNIDLAKADYEFIGMAYFSEEGAKTLCSVYDACLRQQDGPFHEAPSFQRAWIPDMLQELIDRGYPVHGMEVSKGWREIHTREDVGITEAEMAEMAARV